ncbi:MAG: hypothetical protein KJZ54_05840 [Phycisphaerales bacterium]|nr:hypothetical protein [Phycisphaerales bacterium]
MRTGTRGTSRGGGNYFEGHVGIGDDPISNYALFVYSEDQGGILGFTHGQNTWGVYGFANGSGTSYGVIGESNNGTCVGVSGRSFGWDGSSYGVEALNYGSNGMGLYAFGPTYGVYGKSVVAGGIALGGDATGSGSTYGLKVAASSSSGTGAHATGGSVGVHAITTTSSGHAIKAEATTYGIRSTVTGSSGIAVVASATSTGGNNYGVYASTSSSSGRAVRAVASSTSGTNYAIHAHSSGASGRGLYSIVTGSSGRAVYGYCSSSSSTARAVMGYAISPAVAVYAQGNSTTTGTKSFRIDHPLDPTGKYLNHYCTESPQPLNVYSGNVVLDEAGQAWVQLPDYFESINSDIRYQLTTIGGWAPVYVAIEVQDNRFMIAGGQGGMKVSWRVEATRNDAYVRSYGAPVEIEKTDSERGKYLHPEVFGQPEELGIGYDPDAIGPQPPDEEPAQIASGS